MCWTNQAKRLSWFSRLTSMDPLLEDLQDLAVIAERRDEAKISLEEFAQGLKAAGLL